MSSSSSSISSCSSSSSSSPKCNINSLVDFFLSFKFNFGSFSLLFLLFSLSLKPPLFSKSLKSFSLSDFSKNLSILLFNLMIFSFGFISLLKLLGLDPKISSFFLSLFFVGFILEPLIEGKSFFIPFELLLFCRGFKGGIFFLETTVVVSFFSGDFLNNDTFF